MLRVLWLALTVVQPATGAQSLSDLPLQYAVPLSQVAILEVAPEGRVYQVAEPFKLNFTVRNVSNDVILCHCVLLFQSVVMYRLAGEEFQTLHLRDRELEMFPVHRLTPGEMVNEMTIAAYDLRKKAPPFDRPGIYEVRAVYFDYSSAKPASKLESASVFIKVDPPTERDAYEAYSTNLAKLAQFGGETLGVSIEMIEEAAEYLRRFGGSVYTPAIRDGLVALLRNRAGGPHVTEREREIYQEVQREGRVYIHRDKP